MNRIAKGISAAVVTAALVAGGFVLADHIDRRQVFVAASVGASAVADRAAAILHDTVHGAGVAQARPAAVAVFADVTAARDAAAAVSVDVTEADAWLAAAHTRIEDAGTSILRIEGTMVTAGMVKRDIVPRFTDATARKALIDQAVGRADAADKAAADLGLGDRVTRPALAEATPAGIAAFDLDGMNASSAAVEAAATAEREKRAAAERAKASKSQPRNSGGGNGNGGGGNGGGGGGGFSTYGVEVRVDNSLGGYQGYVNSDGSVSVSPATQDGSARGRYVIIHEIGHVKLRACDSGPSWSSKYSEAARQLGYAGADSSRYGAEAAADVWAYNHGGARGFSPYPAAPGPVAALAAACG